MRLVQIKLRPYQPFWFLNEQIQLTANKPTSDFINIDSLEEEDCDIIDASAKNLKVSLFDFEGIKVQSLEEISTVEGEFKVSTEDIEETDSAFPEMVSVTVHEEEPEEEVEEVPDYSEGAKILLSQNGHTVKKAIGSLPKEDTSLHLLHAMLEVENSDKRRKGVINTITAAIGEF